jgi:uncharacterized protein (TIRG00374 family)
MTAVTAPPPAALPGQSPGRAGGPRPPDVVEQAPAISRRARLAGWSASFLLLAAVVLVASHLAEEREMAALMRRAQPAWLLAAAVLQLATYSCAAGVWHRVLSRAGARRRLAELFPLGLAQLFTDQAVPSVGLSGNLLVVKGLVRRGVGRPLAVGAVLVNLVASRLAYSLALAGALTVLGWRGELGPALLAAALVFTLVAVLPLLLLLPLRHRLGGVAARLRRFALVRPLAEALAEAPGSLLADRGLLVQTTGLELAIFLLDASTLGVMLLAVGAPAAPPLVFAAFVMASVAGTLAFVPGGVGIFEGASVAALHLLGVPIVAALAATLLLRGFTFWLPMLPGLWLARRELRAR